MSDTKLVRLAVKLSRAYQTIELEFEGDGIPNPEALVSGCRSRFLPILEKWEAEEVEAQRRMASATRPPSGGGGGGGGGYNRGGGGRPGGGYGRGGGGPEKPPSTPEQHREMAALAADVLRARGEPVTDRAVDAVILDASEYNGRTQTPREMNAGRASATIRRLRELEEAAASAAGPAPSDAGDDDPDALPF